MPYNQQPAVQVVLAADALYRFWIEDKTIKDDVQCLFPVTFSPNADASSASR